MKWKQIALIVIIFSMHLCADAEKKLPFNPAEFQLPNTYLSGKANPELYQKWAPYIGIWRTATSDNEFYLALAPRLAREGEEPGLAGFIVEGEHKGALEFKNPEQPGRLIREKESLTPLEVKLEATSVPSGKGLVLNIQGASPVTMKYWRPINDEYLTRINVVAHKGLGFHDLGNVRVSFDFSRTFGASGIELDITVPLDKDDKPLVNKLLVFHPVRLRASEPLTEIPGKYMPIEEFFKKINTYGVSFFYIDPKVSWLEDGDRRRVLEQIIRFSNEAIKQYPHLTISIGSPNDPTAEYLDRRNWDLPGKRTTNAKEPIAGLSWIAEWYECYFPLPRSFFGIPIDHGRTTGDRVMTDLKLAMSEHSGIRQRAPYIISIAFFNIPGNDGGVVDCLCPDIGAGTEKELGKLPQALILWNINTKSDFDTAIITAKRMGRSINNANNISFMSDYPHRVAFWLASYKP